MKKLILALLATAALATVTAASAAACHGSARFGGAVEKLQGSGSSFAADSANATGSLAGHPLDGGTFGAALSTNWSNTFATRRGKTCAPATGTLSLTGADSSNTVDSSLKGVTCKLASNPSNVAAVFFGTAKVTNATGVVSHLPGYGRVLLVEKTDGTVKGMLFAGSKWGHTQDVARFSKRDGHWGH